MSPALSPGCHEITPAFIRSASHVALGGEAGPRALVPGASHPSLMPPAGNTWNQRNGSAVLAAGLALSVRGLSGRRPHRSPGSRLLRSAGAGQLLVTLHDPVGRLGRDLCLDAGLGFGEDRGRTAVGDGGDGLVPRD